MVFHVVCLLEEFATNVAIEQSLVFILVMASFMNEQIVLLVEGPSAKLAVISLHSSSAFLPRTRRQKSSLSSWIRIHSKHDGLKSWKNRF